MSFSRFGAALFSAAAAVLVAGGSSPALADPWSAAPSVVSAELLSAEGAGCREPAARLMDGWLEVQAQTGADESLRLDGRAAAGAESVGIECLLRVRIQLDQPARVTGRQYLMEGSVRTSAGARATHYFESSFDATDWHGQRTTLSAGYSGPFQRGGDSHSPPWSTCATEVDLFLRVGLSLGPDAESEADAETGVSADDAIALIAPNGAQVELVTDSSDCV